MFSLFRPRFRPRFRPIFRPWSTANDLVITASQLLKTHKIENPKREAGLILAHLLQCDYLQILNNPPVDKKTARQFLRLIKKRSRGLPFAYITGRQEFFSLPFLVNRAVLIPRPISEELCQAVIDHFPKTSPIAIADIGTGSGCLLISLLRHFIHGKGVGIDRSGPALAISKKNSNLLGVMQRIKFLQKNIKKTISLHQQFDAMVANPPYVTRQEYRRLARNIFFEPKTALVANDHEKKNDGLYFYPLIKTIADSHLKPNGILAVECAPRQKKAVEKIFSTAHYKTVVIA